MASRSPREALERLPEIRQYLLDNVRPTGRQLGIGSYGSVEEVEVDGLICAGKRIHEALIGRGQIQRIAQRYVDECRLMSGVRHPNIVQFLGLCFVEDSSLPLLVMEKLMTSLDELLENTSDIPLSIKKSILADVARGLLYLHNRRPSPIVHRDLSAKNVLLNSALVAKVSDLGNSRIVDLQPGQLARTLSNAPGTLVYMPPETMDVRTRYGPSMDIFSYGHLALFTLTQLFPGNLLPHNYPDPHNQGRLIGRSEVERRGEYFSHIYQMLGERHPLVQLVERCLHNDPGHRPTAGDVLQQLEAVQIEDPYQDMTKLDLIRQLQLRAERDGEIETQAQLQQMEEEIRQKDNFLYQQTPIPQLPAVPPMDTPQLRAVPPMTTPQGGGAAAISMVPALHRDTALEFKQLKQMPQGMWDAQAVIYRGTLYVGGGHTSTGSFVLYDFVLFMYQFEPDTWNTINTPTCHYALAVYQDHLVLAGGRLPPHGDATDQLWLTDVISQPFSQSIPPMITATRNAIAITTEDHLIVVGGENSQRYFCTVQVYNGEQWALAQPLPDPASHIKYTCHNNILYLIGGGTQGIGKFFFGYKKVFSVSLPLLLQSTPETTHTVWNTLPDAPFGYSSITVLGSELVAIGGLGGILDMGLSPLSHDIYKYSRDTNCWVKMTSTLPYRLSKSCSIALPFGEAMIIGGWVNVSTSADMYLMSIKQ